MNLPQRLLAPPPGWIVETDVVVVGSGIAGLTTALRIAAGGPEGSGLRVLVVTKDVLAAGSTRWAQGGIAAALGPDDSAEAHLQDTLVAGVGICDVDAVRVLVDEGPQAVRELIELGTRFDRSSTGELSLTREGGHHADRIAHAGGDATGAEIERALVAAVLATPGIEVIEHALVLDLLPTTGGGVGAVTLHVMGEGQLDGVGAVRARAFVLATGGIGQIYAATTNPPVSTGDGVAAALRAGAVVRDLEFVQFHPTVLWLGGSAAGQQPLVSEAVRGEGAVLLDGQGVRFMQGQHELADLAPRDVVAKAILRRMRETGAEHMWLDARHFGAEKWRVRFPTILATLTSLGLDPVSDLIPVAPACHYASGGIATDLSGRTSVAGLYACGEAACTGVHGANRLASNSLLEGLVFGRRIAADVLSTVPAGSPLLDLGIDVRGKGIAAAGIRRSLQQQMSADAGVIRDAAGLARAAAGLQKLAAQRSSEPRTESWEATNLLTVASALVAAASRRAETRGSHWREDHPDRDDQRWCGHLDLRLGPDGTISTDYIPSSHQLPAEGLHPGGLHP
ncbi:MAG TPA: L-aspartate oxidase [Jatrophihabitans sp.]|jgi:L-aspartate oxidase|uniref:L-aspartate oxidase n=1 Tax=Jatrophihabitans sp. TaxID=1932789 RepID=UPI002F0CA9D1